MLAPLIRAGLFLAGVYGVGWASKEAGEALKETGEALDSATRLTKWAIVGGSVYVSYKALQSAGAIK